MNRSGIIKRGLAATAISALAVAGIPALAGTAHAAVGSISVTGVANGQSGITAFDIDEFATAGDIVATVLEANGTTPSPAGTDIEYDVAFTPVVGAPVPADGTFVAGGEVVGNQGKADLTFVPAAAGTYTLTVRATATLVTAAPITITVGESEVYWADGVSASSPINGTDSYTATLALTNAARTPLVNRNINIELTGESDENFPLQTLPTARVDADSATSVTGADGKFTVSLVDPVTNPQVPNDVTLTATAPGLGAGDAAASNASAPLQISFEPQPVVTSITVTRDNVFAGEPAPGKGVELNVVVRGQAVADDTPANDPILEDYPVNFAVNNGFLTTDTQGAGLNVTPTDLVLKAGESDLNDLFGSYQDLGADESVDTTDNAATDAAGVVATIGKDAGFNDDGKVAQTVTITAGGKTATETINYNVENYLNIPAVAFRKDGGSTNVPGSVDLKFYAVDQFGNLVGNQDANIFDNTPVARVTPEANADTDYLNDNPAATATSTQPVTQKVTGTIQANKNLVDANGNPAAQTTAPVSGDITLVWKKAGPGGKSSIVAKLTGNNNGGQADKLTVVAPKKANGATVKLFKVVKGKLKPAGTKTLKNGRASFSKADKNGNAFTKYVAKVQSTNDTKGARTNKRNLR